MYFNLGKGSERNEARSKGQLHFKLLECPEMVCITMKIGRPGGHCDHCDSIRWYQALATPTTRPQLAQLPHVPIPT